MPFDSPDLMLSDLLRDVGVGKVQLPDFQREWKWDDPRIASLLASVSLGHPVGVAMTLETGGAGVQFAPKPLAGVPFPLSSPEPEQLLLDGQQRLTSLYQALMSNFAVDTTDPRGKRLRRWYYLDMAAALDPDADREDAVISVPEDRKQRDNFGREVVADYSSTTLECGAEMFPLSIVFDTAKKNAWMVAYLQLDSDTMPARLERWNLFDQQVLANFSGYAIPVIRLHKDTPKEAVCTVFEKVNTAGVPLNVFELLTATFASSNFRLKDDWAAREAELRKKPALRSLESADFLQAVSLLTTYTRRQQYLSGGDAVGAPGVSCKRRDILRLTLADYQAWADRVQAAFVWVAQFLGQEHIFRSDDLPYRTQLVPLAAIKVVLGVEADTHGAADKLRQWYWCGVLGELYGGAIETRFARDLEQTVPWVRAAAPAPGTVAEAAFREPRLLSLRTRNSAAYKGLYALLMRDKCLDWIKDQPMNMATFFEFQIDIHHVFPKAWCDKNNVDHGHRESIVNKTAISYSTNRSIGGRSPAEYMTTLASKAGVDDARIDTIVATHRINPAHLRSANFDAYFAERKDALLALISSAMGKEAIRDETAAVDQVDAFVEDADDIDEPADEALAS